VNENRIRYFHELSDEEADRAVGIVFRQISDDYESGNIELIGYVSEANLQDRLWDIAGAIVEDAVFIPDDGSMVVRL
jgi:hypothetical protein